MFIDNRGEAIYLTPGILELFYKKVPGKTLVSSDDLRVYKNIIL